MIMRAGIRNREAHRHDIEKRGIAGDGTVAAEIVADMEQELVAPGLHCFTREQRRVGAAIGVGHDFGDAARAAVGRLPSRCRQIFLLSREDGLTYPEIARVLGISVKTVETQMGRALKSLRASLHHFRE